MGGKNKKPISFDYDLVVIGAGTAGSVAANLAANHAKKVAIIENNKIGGEQLWSTTIPTKWLIESLKFYQKAKKANSQGLDISVSPISIDKIKHYLRKTQNKASGAETNVFKDENIKTYNGNADFIDKYHISINGKKISSKYFLVAPGASPENSIAKKFNVTNFLTYRDLAELNFSGNSFCFIGAGSVAYEYSQILTILGFNVHVIEKNNHILPKSDNEVSDISEDILIKHSVKLHTASFVEDIKQSNGKSIIHFIKNQRRYRLAVDNLVLASGKMPNVKNLSLENANVHFDEKGIKTNRKMQTSQKNIFAAGDVVGSESGYEAIYDAQIAVHNMYFRKKLKKSRKAIPKVVYGSTEIATVGVSELQLKLSGEVYQSSIAPAGITARSLYGQYELGFVKILANHKGIVVGASVVGENATELINILSVAINNNMQACDLAKTVYSSPSWSESIKIAASKIYCL
jgi:dihydrolipoamide dehydrogenase